MPGQHMNYALELSDTSNTGHRSLVTEFMRLGIFMMPLHPLNRDPAQTLQEDREAIILADRLGFYDAFVGEHLTDKAENVTNSFIFLATLIDATKTIKLATGTSNLSQAHPTLIAAHAAMFDHLAKGRFIFGVSPGALSSDAEALGILDEDRNRLFAEAMDVILAICSATRPTTSRSPATASRSRPRRRTCPISARASCTSHTRSRGPRSSAQWWRRSRRA